MISKEEYVEGLIDVLLATIGSGRSTRNFRSILFERKLKRYKKESVRIALYRLRVKGYLNSSNALWSITKKGEKQLRKVSLLQYIRPYASKKSENNTIISFDIPEKNRVVRNWLRNQIKIFGYKMLQQSLWIGPGPLPYSFMKRLEDLGIRKNIKVFNVKKLG